MRATLCLLALFMQLPAHAAEIDIVIEGGDTEIRQNIENNLSIYQYRAETSLTEAAVQRLHARAYDEIDAALQAFGYYEAVIQAELQATEDGWRAVYRVQLGRAVRIADFSVQIYGSAELQDALRELLGDRPLRVGDPLRHGAYAAFKSALLARAYTLGFLEARYSTHEILVDRARYTARIRLELMAGPRFVFGATQIRQTVLADDVMRRYLSYESGDPFNFDELLNIRYAMSDSEYFSAIEIEADPANAGLNNEIPVNISGLPNRRFKYTAGLGYGTDTGGRIRLGVRNRFVNDRGHQAGAEIEVAEIRRGITLGYSIPLKNPAQDKLLLNSHWEDQELADQRSVLLGVGANLVRRLGDWQRTLFLRYEREHDTTIERESRTALVLPGISYNRTRADNLLSPRNGDKLFFELRGSSVTLGANVGFLQTQMQAKKIFSAGDRWRFLLRAELGYTDIEDTFELPTSHRFFAGGDQSVRGFDYNQLAPQDADGNIVGGKYLATASAEMNYMFTPQWGAALFSDIGNAMDDYHVPLEQSWGIGLRWRTVIGMIRIDLARPVDPALRPSAGAELHISIGPEL